MQILRHHEDMWTDETVPKKTLHRSLKKDLLLLLLLNLPIFNIISKFISNKNFIVQRGIMFNIISYNINRTNFFIWCSVLVLVFPVLYFSIFKQKCFLLRFVLFIAMDYSSCLQAEKLKRDCRTQTTPSFNCRILQYCIILHPHCYIYVSLAIHKNLPDTFISIQAISNAIQQSFSRAIKTNLQIDF